MSSTIRVPFRIGENFIAPDFGPEGYPTDDDIAWDPRVETAAKPSFLSGVKDLRDKLKQSSHLTTTNVIMNPSNTSYGYMPRNSALEGSQSNISSKNFYHETNP